MALIKCPECGKQISDKAVSCPSCGMPIYQSKKEVMIRFPIYEGQLFNNKCYVYDKRTGKVLASGKQGETVSFKCNNHTRIYVVVKGSFGKPEVVVNPGDRFEVGYRGFGQIYISRVDEISGKADTMKLELSIFRK